MAASDGRRVSRRGALRGIGIGSGIVAAAPVTHRLVRGPEVITEGAAQFAGAHRPAPGIEVALDASVGAFLDGIAPGAAIDRWRVVAVRGVHLGAIAVVMEDADGARFQVDVLRRADGGRAEAIARTPSLEVWLSNRGDGATPTVEEQGLGAMALAEVLARREAEGAVVPALLTRDERRARHPLGAYRIPV